MNERFLIVGLGSIGRRHLTNLRKLRPDSEIAVLRSGVNAASTCPAEANAQFTEWSDALAFAPMAAVIANPATAHLDAARKLLSAHVPMLIEKPIAHNLTGLRAFADEAATRKLPALVGYNLRLLPSLAQCRSLINEGAIGDVLAARAEVGQYLPDWRPTMRYQDGVSARRALGGGPLLELSHELDYLYWMFGLPRDVTARGGRYSDLEIDVEDVVEVTLEYGARKRLVNVHLDFLQRKADRRCRFIGAEGTLVWNGIDDTIDLYRAATGQWEHLQFAGGDRNQMYLNELSQFLDFIHSGAPTDLPSVVEGYDVLAVVDAATESMRCKRTVEVNGYAKSCD